MIIEFPSRSGGIATLEDLLAAIERQWSGNMDLPAIAIHIARLRLAVWNLSDVRTQSPSELSIDWLLSLTAGDLKRMALGVAPTSRREFFRGSRLLIQHAQVCRDNEPKCAQPLTAGFEA